MRTLLLVSAGLMVLTGSSSLTPLAAQAPLPVGVRNVAWPNPTGQGSSTLAARVLYPATVAGNDAPLLPRVGGWPTVVFLHGFALLGNSYGALGSSWAEQGFVVVLGNTAQFDNLGQEQDGRALFAALQAATAPTGGAFADGIDLQRVALAGHSMGGGNVANVLASNPGYRCGLAIAPVPPRGNNGAAVAVPLGIVAGTGDVITPPASNAQPYYQSLTAYRELKFLYLLNGDATHTNLPGLFLTGGVATEVFTRCAAVGRGFLEHALGLSADALDEALGPPALAESRLVMLEQEFARAQMWTDGPLLLAGNLRASAGIEPGIGGVAAAFADPIAPVSTPFGELRLDPATALVLQVGVVGSGRRLDAMIAVPNVPSLIGSPLSLQAFGPTRDAALQLGGAVGLVVQP